MVGGAIPGPVGLAYIREVTEQPSQQVPTSGFLPYVLIWLLSKKSCDLEL